LPQRCCWPPRIIVWGLLSCDTKWTLSGDAFEKLLSSLSANREAAGVAYESLRRKLVSFFDWRGAPDPEGSADEVFDRIAKKLEAGETIREVPTYALGVARIVLMELGRSAPTQEIEDDSLAAVQRPPLSGADIQLDCLDECLSELPLADRLLIVEYYRFDKREKIDHRHALAEKLGIPMNALRIRAHRIRLQVERCVTSRLARRVK
jgi:DNA-directed RNA polymerase specialized sigma24 family protein